MDTTRIIDLLSRKNIWHNYKEYNLTQWYSKEQMNEYQLNKLRKLIHHCYHNIPYYTKIMKDNGIDPNTIESMNYLEKFPILTKEIIKKNYELFMPINSNNIRGI